MGGPGAGQPSLNVPPSMGTGPNADTTSPPVDDPISALFSSLGGQGNATPGVVSQRPRTLVQKLIPVLHVLSMLAMLAWFVVWKEPEIFAANWSASTTKLEGSEQATGYDYEFGWGRWARLARGPPAGLAILPLVRHIHRLGLLVVEIRLSSPPFSGHSRHWNWPSIPYDCLHNLFV